MLLVPKKVDAKTSYDHAIAQEHHKIAYLNSFQASVEFNVALADFFFC